jgi:hypothetical protein
VAGGGGGEFGVNKGTQMPNVAARSSRSNASPIPSFESCLH